MKLILIILGIGLVLPVSAQDFTKQAQEYANAQKPPYKQIILENIEKQFKSKDSDGGVTVTEGEFNVLKRFVASMSGMNQFSTSKPTKATASDSSEIKTITEILNFTDKDIPAKMLDAIKCYKYANFLHSHSTENVYGERVLKSGAQSNIISYTKKLDLPSPATYTDDDINTLGDMIQKCDFLLDTNISSCSVPCFEPSRLTINIKMLQKVSSKQYLVAAMTPRVGGSQAMMVAAGTLLVTSETELERGSAKTVLLQGGWETPTMTDGFKKDIRTTLSIELGPVSALLCRMQQFKDGLNKKFGKGKFVCGYKHVQSDFFESRTAGLVCASRSDINEDSKIKGGNYIFPIEYKECK